MEDTSPALAGPILALAVLILDLLDVNSKSFSKSSWLTELDAMPVISLQRKNPHVIACSSRALENVNSTTRRKNVRVVQRECEKEKKWVLTKNTWTSEQRVGRL
jgi:hypothetical protein